MPVAEAGAVVSAGGGMGREPDSRACTMRTFEAMEACRL